MTNAEKKKEIRFYVHCVIRLISVCAVTFTVGWTIMFPIIYWNVGKVAVAEAFDRFAIGLMVTVPLALATYCLQKFLAWYWDILEA